MPDGVVADDREHGKMVCLRDEMAGRGIVEHVSSISAARNHGLFRMGEFHAQPAADSPAESARGRPAEITGGLAQAEMLL